MSSPAITTKCFPKSFGRNARTSAFRDLPIPTEYGGGGADTLTTVCALEALGYGCADNGLLFSINAHMWSSEIPIWNFGTEEQKKKYLPGLVSGGIGLACHDRARIGVRRVQPEDARGAKGRQIHPERLEDVQQQRARCGRHDRVRQSRSDPRSERRYGIPGRQGNTRFHRRQEAAQDGTAHLADGGNVASGLRNSGLEPAWARNSAGRRSSLRRWSGSASAFWPAIWARCSASWKPASSTPKSASNLASRSAKFPAINNKIADMDVRLETGRLALYKAAWLKSQGRHPLREASIAKLYVSEACVQSCLDAIQIHGGYGYMTEYELERELRDAIAGTIYSGTSEVHRVIIGEFLRAVIVVSCPPNTKFSLGLGPEIMAYVLQQLLTQEREGISGKAGGLGSRQEPHLPRTRRALEPAGAPAAQTRSAEGRPRRIVLSQVRGIDRQHARRAEGGRSLCSARSADAGRPRWIHHRQLRHADPDHDYSEACRSERRKLANCSRLCILVEGDGNGNDSRVAWSKLGEFPGFACADRSR